VLFLALFNDFDLQPAGSERRLKLAIVRCQIARRSQAISRYRAACHARTANPDNLWRW